MLRLSLVMDYSHILDDLVAQNNTNYDTNPAEMGEYSLEATRGLSPIMYDTSPQVIEANYKRASFKYQ